MSKEKPILNTISNIIDGAKNATAQQKGRPSNDNEEARTYRVNKTLATKIRIIAHREGHTQKDLLNFAFAELVRRYEEKKGEIDVTTEYRSAEGIEDLFK